MDSKDHSENLDNNELEKKIENLADNAEFKSDSFSNVDITMDEGNKNNQNFSDNNKESRSLNLNNNSEESQKNDLQEEKEKISWQSSDSRSEEEINKNQELLDNKEKLSEEVKEKSNIESKEPPSPLYVSREEREGKFFSSNINLSSKHDPFIIIKRRQRKNRFKRIKERYKTSSPLARFFLKYFLLFLFVYIIVYLVFNGPVFLRRFGIWQNKNVSNTVNQSSSSDSNISSTQDSQPVSQDNSSEDTNSQTSSSQNQTQTNIPQVNKLVIPKIGVDAPIIFLNSNSEAEMRVGLLGGVVHYYQTALPGEVGNCFIFGHSSNYWWEKSSYNYVFSTLDRMQVGDKADIYFSNQAFKYEVIEVKIVEPSDTSVLNPTSEPTLTLMTCTPPGTSWKRLIIRLKQIYPVYKPKIAEKPKETPKLPEELPQEKQGIIKKTYNFFYNLIH